MGNIMKVTAQWTGFLGAPGYSNFYWRDSQPEASWDSGATVAADAVQAFFTSIKALFPSGVTWRVSADVPVIDETTGQLVDVLSAGARTDVVATAPVALYTAVSGAVVTWRSSGVRNGRRVRGRTFLVPLANSAYTNNGQMAPTPITTITGAATNLILAGTTQDFLVWARPTSKGASDGVAHSATSATVPSKVAVLKSRRD